MVYLVVVLLIVVIVIFFVLKNVLKKKQEKLLIDLQEGMMSWDKTGIEIAIRELIEFATSYGMSIGLIIMLPLLLASMIMQSL